MALHNLKITVIDGGRQFDGKDSLNEDDKKDKSKTGKNSLLYKVLNYNNTIKREMKEILSPTKFFAVQTGINLATQTARQAVNYYVSDIGRKNGDSNYQAIISRRLEIGSDIAGVIGGAVNGAATGSMFSPAGAVIGGIVGAAGAGASLGFKYGGRESAYQHEMFKENNSQAYSLARANYAALTGRVR